MYGCVLCTCGVGLKIVVEHGHLEVRNVDDLQVQRRVRVAQGVEVQREVALCKHAGKRIAREGSVCYVVQ